MAASRIAAAAAAVLALAAPAWGRPMTEEEILAGASQRIERHRKADALVRVVGRDGAPVRNARVDVEQVSQAFLFGANAFPVLGYGDAERERRYEEAFTGLMNYATLGFYWGAYEPAAGRTRAEDLARQARWCQEHGIAVKGHPLVWHEVYPAWAPAEADAARARLQERVSDIVQRFAGRIDRWDVVNEVTVSASVENGVGRWAARDGGLKVVEDSLAWARRANPRGFLLYNDFNVGPAYEKFAQALVGSGAPVDAFGIQSHMHGGEWPIPRVWEVCETYARFGRPLDWTEVTVLSGQHGWQRPPPWPTTPEGEARQADYVVKLYTVLFSHPAVEAITWWDLMDGAWQGAPAGLLRADLTAKPAYERLRSLVRGRWMTRASLSTGSDGTARFRGFLGRYRLTVTLDGRTATRELDLSRGAGNTVVVPAP